MAVKPPANKSSAIIPIPPDIFLSIQLIGQGFNISKNLNSLKEAGIVGVRRDKQRAFYFLSEDFMSNTHLIEHFKGLKSSEKSFTLIEFKLIKFLLFQLD